MYTGIIMKLGMYAYIMPPEAMSTPKSVNTNIAASELVKVISLINITRMPEPVITKCRMLNHAT
jgi:hypothetical protein